MFNITSCLLSPFKTQVILFSKQELNFLGRTLPFSNVFKDPKHPK